MDSGRAVILIVATMFVLSIPGAAECKCVRTPKRHSVGKTPNVDLEMAKIYVRLLDWKDAEIHFAAAVKDPACQKEALAGLELARKNVDAAPAAVLKAGQLYESNKIWAKAEDLYRSGSTDPSIRDEARSALMIRLTGALDAQREDRLWTEWTDRIEKFVKWLVFLLAVILFVCTCDSILKRRKMILIHPFSAPNDDLSKLVAFNLKFARAAMQNPALSPAGQMPPALVESLLFNDEVETIEDLEIAGSKVPFSFLAKLFGRPAIQVNGGFDGVAPEGYAYSTVKIHNGIADDFRQQMIRVGTPNERRDLLDFAYDVLVRATAAYELL